MLSSELLTIGAYVPASQSENSTESRRILKVLRSKLDTPAKASQDELDTLSDLMKKDDAVRKQISQELMATIPKTTLTGSVAQALYSCVTSSGKIDSCSPECVTGLPLSGQKSCKNPVYMKTSSGLTKLNDVTGPEANVYATDAFTGFTEKEEDELRSSGISNVVLLERESRSNRYRSKETISLASQSKTRSYAKDESCAKSVSFSETSTVYSPEGKSSKTYTKSSSSQSRKDECSNSSFSFIYVIMAVILVIILIGIAFVVWNSFTAIPQKEVTKQRTHLVWED